MSGFLVSVGVWVEVSENTPAPRPARPVAAGQTTAAPPESTPLIPEPMHTRQRPRPRPQLAQPLAWVYAQDTDPAKMMAWQEKLQLPTRLPRQVREGHDRLNAYPLPEQESDRPWDAGLPQLPTRRPRPVAPGQTSLELGIFAQRQPWDVAPQLPVPLPPRRRLDAESRCVTWPLSDDVQSSLVWGAQPTTPAAPRPRPRQGTHTDPPPPAWSIDVALFRAACDQDPQQPVRLARLRTQDVVDLGAIAWSGYWIALDALGRAWEVDPQLPTRRRGPVAAGQSGMPTLDTAQVGPTVPLPQGGQVIPVRMRPVCRPGEGINPPWIAANVVVVKGPYYIVSGTIYTAGSIEGDVTSAD